MTSTTTTSTSSFDLYRLGQASTPSSWLVSDWGAGQTTIMDWSSNNVRVASDGAVELVLDNAPAGSTSRPFQGGEIQSQAVATTGTWSWTAQAPRMVDGAVFGMFLYKADWKNDPWLEFDFEFVGADTTKVQLAIHMENEAGQHIKNMNKVVIDLGFDAALASHTYEITLDGTSADFEVDGRLIASFDASDMPGGVWNTGALKSYVDLWAADPRYTSWTGTWVDPIDPLVARLQGATVQPGVVSAPHPFVGDTQDNVIQGTASGEVLDGQGGNDTLQGGDGDDTLLGRNGNDRLEAGTGNDIVQGGDGSDRLGLDAGNDRLDGGAGVDCVTVTGSAAATISLATTTAQDTGAGLDTLIGIENAQGGAGNDRLSGSGGANMLDGKAGNDILRGSGGADRIIGGLGYDDMTAGSDSSRDVFVFASAKESLVGSSRDVVRQFNRGVDDIDVSGIDARTGLAGDQAFGFSGTTAKAHSLWTAQSGADLILRGDLTGDRVADFEIRLASVSQLTAGDFVL